MDSVLIKALDGFASGVRKLNSGAVYLGLVTLVVICVVSLYGIAVKCSASGQYGFSVRVLPKNPSLPSSYEPGLVTWG